MDNLNTKYDVVKNKLVMLQNKLKLVNNKNILPEGNMQLLSYRYNISDINNTSKNNELDLEVSDKKISLWHTNEKYQYEELSNSSVDELQEKCDLSTDDVNNFLDYVDKESNFHSNILTKLLYNPPEDYKSRQQIAYALNPISSYPEIQPSDDVTVQSWLQQQDKTSLTDLSISGLPQTELSKNLPKFQLLHDEMWSKLSALQNKCENQYNSCIENQEQNFFEINHEFKFSDDTRVKTHIDHEGIQCKMNMFNDIGYSHASLEYLPSYITTPNCSGDELYDFYNYQLDQLSADEDIINNFDSLSNHDKQNALNFMKASFCDTDLQQVDNVKNTINNILNQSDISLDMDDLEYKQTL